MSVKQDENFWKAQDKSLDSDKMAVKENRVTAIYCRPDLGWNAVMGATFPTQD